jgi:hypothetical protein
LTTDTNEAWSTMGRKKDNLSIEPPRFEGCLVGRVEDFILHGGPCPFTPKEPEILTGLDVGISHNARSWIPEHSWTWKDDDTWVFADFCLGDNR